MSRVRPTPHVLLLLLLTGLPALGAAPAGDDWLGQDKAKHFAITLGLAGAGYGASAWAFDASPRARLFTGAGLALGVGLGKELYDVGRGGRFSGKDLAWDVAGAATGLALAWLIDRLLFSDTARPSAARSSTESASALMDAGSGARKSAGRWNAACCRAVTLRRPPEAADWRLLR
jgi:putative lipoprotein